MKEGDNTIYWSFTKPEETMEIKHRAHISESELIPKLPPAPLHWLVQLHLSTGDFNVSRNLFASNVYFFILLRNT